MATHRETLEQRRFSVEEYHRMANAGILAPDERGELIQGLVRTMSPKTRVQVIATTKLLGLMMRELEGRASVYKGAPLQVRELDSEPEPDVLVCSNPDFAAYGTSETTAVLVIEVAESSLAYDLVEKAALYAEAGVPEYWVVNLLDAVIEVFRQPRNGRFESRQVVGGGERLAPEAWPDATIELPELFRDLET